MNFRGLLSVFLVLGIVLATSSSPTQVSDEGSKSNLKVRDHWKHQRSFTAEASVLDVDGNDVPKKKQPPPPPSRPKMNMQPPSPKARPGPRKQQPKPNKPAKQAPGKQQSKSNKPAKQAPVKQQSKSNKPAGQALGKQQSKSNKPAKNGASCAIRRRNILTGEPDSPAFNPACDEASLTLGLVTKLLKKVGSQGNSAITYQVTDGWPAHVKGELINVTAYAKTGKTGTEMFATETMWLEKIGQLLAKGKYKNRQFIVSVKFHKDKDACREEFEKTLLPLIVKEAKVYVVHSQVLHTDIQPSNILWDDKANHPTLIDWGRAQEVTSWDDTVEKRVKRQATFSFLAGPQRIC
ncbi:hypothetical protein ONZ45_g7342 [Pleurotus djamor]|nr:hypothetical protein ONZ45_g7342 [Pleurotus djamor]